MAGNSFYGGKHGISFILVEHYDSIKDMVDNFKRGGAYSDVSYGEYVIIDTWINLNNKTSIENGIIYKRGFDYLEQPKVFPDKEDFKDSNGNLNKVSYEKAVLEYCYRPGGGAIYVGKIVGPQGETPKMEIMPESVVKNYTDVWSGNGKLDIIAGNKQKNVTYAYCNIRDEHDNIVGCVVGLTIPYHYFEFSAKSVSAYSGNFDEDTKTWSYTGLAQKTYGNDDKDPYYSKWNINIPKGLHGIDFVALGVDSDTMQYYYQTRDYTKTEEGNVTRYNLEDIFHRVIKKTSFDDTTSEFVIDYTVGNSDRIKARFLYDISFDEESNKIKVEYSDYENGEHVSKLIGSPIKFIEKIEYDNSDQYVKVYYNTKDATNNQEIDVIEKKFKVIENIGLNNNNKIVVTYNTVNSEGVQDTDILDYAFKFIDDVNINDNQKIEISYIVGTNEEGPIIEKEEIGSALNFIIETALDDRYHLLVLYSDPVIRAAAVAAGKSATWDDSEGISHTDWYDLGYIRGETGGVRIVGDVSSVTELPPNGLSGEYKGWLYTVTQYGNSVLYAYDYSDNQKGWYAVGTLDASLTEPAAVITCSKADLTGNAPLIGGENLNQGGFWFVIK